jgi:hypothetical protein
MITGVFSSGRSAALAAVFALLVGVPQAPAQQTGQIGNKEDTEYPFRRLKPQFDKWADGEVRPDPVKDKSNLQLAAKYHVYRLTWVTERKGTADIQKDLKDLMLKPATLEGRNKDFMKLFAQEVIPCLKTLVMRDMMKDSQVVTNAALMLPVLALCKQDEVNDFLLDLVNLDKDKDTNFTVHPFVRMCAVEGLGELNNSGPPRIYDEYDPDSQVAKKKRELKRFNALVSFIAFSFPPQGTHPAREDAYRFARRKGITALAQLETPAINVIKDKTDGKEKVDGGVAYHLIYLASGGEMRGQAIPQLSLDEKLEAAIGICHLKPALTPNYNVQLGLYVVAKCIADFAADYQTDYLYFAPNANVDAKEKEVRKGQSKMAWKLEAARFQAAMEALDRNVPGESPAYKYVTGLKAAVKEILDKISRRIQIETPSELRLWAQSMKPASTEVYLGIKESAIPVK